MVPTDTLSNNKSAVNSYLYSVGEYAHTGVRVCGQEIEVYGLPRAWIGVILARLARAAVHLYTAQHTKRNTKSRVKPE